MITRLLDVKFNVSVVETTEGDFQCSFSYVTETTRYTNWNLNDVIGAKGWKERYFLALLVPAVRFREISCVQMNNARAYSSY